MIPAVLSEWTLNAVEQLLAQGVFESDRFDFKEMLPHAKSNTDKLRLRKTCAAFANSAGGFLIFGVKDEKGLSVADRLVGLDPAFDFPTNFGSFASTCQPSVEWAFQNPPLRLPQGRIIHVVHIPPGVRCPHAVAEDDRWHFVKRTNKGNEAMSYEEVRLAFQDTEMRRTKLALLASELSLLRELAEKVVADAPQTYSEVRVIRDSVWLTRYPTTVVDSVLGDAFALLKGRGGVWQAVARVRALARRSNALASAVAVAITNGGRDWGDNDRVKHETMIRETAREIINECNVACGEVEAYLGTP